MGKSWEVLRNRLLMYLSPHGAVSEFCRKTGLARSGVDRWLLPKEKGGGSPNIENLDAIADALGITPWDLIKPENEETISLEEHFKALESYSKAQRASTDALERANTLCQAQAKELHGYKQQLSDPFIREMVSLLASLDETERRGLLMQIRLTVEGKAMLGKGSMPNRKKA